MKCETCIHYCVCMVNSYCHVPCGYYEEKRPHAEWIPFSGNVLDVRMKCSICGSVEMPLLRHNFCPNCGADMRKEGEEK